MATPQEIATCVDYLAASCRNFRPNEATLAVWCEEFANTHPEALQAACRAHVRASKHNAGPAIGELLERAGEWRQERDLRGIGLPAHERPPATPEQIQAACKDALARIAAAPDIGGPGPAHAKAALKAAIQAIAPPKAREDTPW